MNSSDVVKRCVKSETSGQTPGSLFAHKGVRQADARSRIARSTFGVAKTRKQSCLRGNIRKLLSKTA